jgi:hypothetical protein
MAFISSSAGLAHDSLKKLTSPDRRRGWPAGLADEEALALARLLDLNLSREPA